MKITTIDQVLDLAETLNKVYEATNVTTEIRIKDIESDEDIRALAKLMKGNSFEPCEEIPYVWCSVQLGNIRAYVQGISKKVIKTETKFI